MFVDVGGSVCFAIGLLAVLLVFVCFLSCMYCVFVLFWLLVTPVCKGFGFSLLYVCSSITSCDLMESLINL